MLLLFWQWRHGYVSVSPIVVFWSSRIPYEENRRSPYEANLMNMPQSRLRNFHVILTCPSERSHLIDILDYLYLLSCQFINGNARACSLWAVVWSQKGTQGTAPRPWLVKEQRLISQHSIFSCSTTESVVFFFELAANDFRWVVLH